MERLRVGDKFKTAFLECEVIADETETAEAKCKVISSAWPYYAKIGDVRLASSRLLGLKTMERIKSERK
jgi:hypothetical protein